jgi:foldase protein PrsA
MLPSNRKVGVKPLIVGLAMLLAVLALSSCGGKDNKADKEVVAEYTGGTVTQNEFDGFLGAHKFFNYSEMYMFYESMPDFKNSMLNQYIATEVLTNDVSKKTQEESDERAEKDMKALKDSLKDDESYKTQFETFLKENNIEEADLEDYITKRYNLDSVFSEKFTDEQIKKKYDEEIAKDKNAYVTTATVRHILIKTVDEEGKEVRKKEDALKIAQEVQQKLENGGDWTALAKEYSEDPGSKDKGGLYADAQIAQWDPAFAQAALTQELNVIGAPFESSFGYHVMVVEARNSNAYEDVKGAAKSQLISEFFGNYIDTEIPKLITKNNLPEPEEPAPAGETPDAETPAEDKPTETK